MADVGLTEGGEPATVWPGRTPPSRFPDRLAPLTGGGACAHPRESGFSWYSPAVPQANFVVSVTWPPADVPLWAPEGGPSTTRHAPFTAGTRSAGILASVPVPFLDLPRPHAFAHRGGAAHAPENSWTAFEYAVKLGYAYLETDARATSDGKLVAFHDRTLSRVTGVPGRIGALPYREVAALRVAGTEPVPLIEDLLGAWPDVRFNIDLKDEPGIGLLPGVLHRTASWDRVCVTSFSGSRLRAARELLERPVCMATSPAVIAAIRYSIGAASPDGQASLLARSLSRWQVRCAQVPGKVANASFMRRAHALGLDVHVWTINDRAQMTRLLDLGADGIMTDDIETLRKVLIERGQWHPRAGAAAV